MDHSIRSGESWEEYGEIIRPVLGVRYVILSPARAYELGFNVTNGALIIGNPQSNQSPILEGSPAEAAGLQSRDIILAVDGESIDLMYTLQDAIQRHQVGDEVVLQVWRDGEIFEVTVESAGFAWYIIRQSSGLYIGW